ncbi:acetate--CoA ligase family protein [Roseomonas sp. BN140053]|uniref:acetate--CoA ligase family protein n=1 Tax=Roseomonas sp. BN140053 TaxID=3391898 RepID=UPI0039E78AFF
MGAAVPGSAAPAGRLPPGTSAEALPAAAGGERRDAVTRLLRPRSVAVIGASPAPGSLGGGVLANLERFRFAGPIHLVHPTRAEINGRPCLPSPDALPEGVDCAVLAIPRAGVMEAAAACARRGVGGLILFSAGFAEAGEEGRAEQEKLAALARAHGMAIEGPNCLGMVNYVDGIPLTFGGAQPIPLRGPGLGVVSQSGAMASVLRAALQAREIDVTFTISTGNEALNGIEDFLEPLLADDATAAVAMVVEQFRDPPRFLDLARRARAMGKPILLLHPGRSAAARLSAQTHTGAMSGDHAVMRTLVAQAGVLAVDTLEELIDLGELTLRCPARPQAGAAVMTDSGAFKALTLDFCEDVGLPLPSLPPDTEAALRAVVPDFFTLDNPLDLTAQALVDPDLYRRTLAPLLDSAAFGSVVLAVILTGEETSRRKLPPIIDALAELKPAKPVVLAMLGEEAPVPPELVSRFRALGVPFFRSPERALRALARFTETPERAAPASTGAPAAASAPSAAPPAPASSGGPPAAAAPAGAAAPEVPPLDLAPGPATEHRSKAILAALGIPVPAGELVHDLAAAQDAAARIGFPVVLKAQAAALAHKSDAGGVVLRLTDPETLAAGWDALHAALARTRPGLVLDSVLVERMASPGTELILGARRDPNWGPVLLVGLGGIWAEALHDVRLLPADLPEEAIAAEIHQLKGAALLRGFRGTPALDIPAAAAIAARLGALLRAAPELTEVEINPVMLYPQGQGAIALDALVVRG